MQLQGSNYYLQGGTGTLQGSSYNPQITANPQPAAGQINLSSGTVYLPSQTPISSNVQQFNDQTSQINALLASLRAQQEAQAPYLDLNAINAQARGAAEGAVNPFYTKQMNDYLAQQATMKAQQQQQTQMNITNYEQQLQNTLQGNEIQQGRTAQDVLTNEQQIAQKQNEMQQDTGTQFEQARIAQAKQLAGQGITQSGMGQQQVTQATQNRNIAESRQVQDFQQQQQQQELFKTRTFEDLARSGVLATQTKEKGVQQVQFDLDNYIKNQESQAATERNQLEQQRLQALATEQQTQRQMLISNFINAISNPAQKAAAIKAYL